MDQRQFNKEMGDSWTKETAHPNCIKEPQPLLHLLFYLNGSKLSRRGKAHAGNLARVMGKTWGVIFGAILP